MTFENGSKNASERRKGALRERKRSKARKGERESESRMDEENALKGKEEQLDGMKA